MSDAARAIAPTLDPTFWNLSAPHWDVEFRAWAAPLLKLSAEHAGLAVILIGQLIECAWRLRRINTTLATDANLTDRDACRALAEAQRAFSRAQTDYQRWVRNTERGQEQSGGVRGARATRPAPRGVDGSAPLIPSIPAQISAEKEDTQERPEPHGSTHTNNIVASGAPEPAPAARSPLEVIHALGRAVVGRRRHSRAVKRALERLR